MPTLNADAQSLLLNGRRIWLMACHLEAALTDPATWPEQLAALRQVGFNTVRVSAPWSLHEPRQGRFAFTGALDLPAFLAAAHEAGLMALVRVGPVVGEPFADGGLPAWTAELGTGRTREHDEAFLGAVSQWFQQVLGKVAPLQATRDKPGPVVGVELEYQWQSGDADAAEPYFAHLVRVARECGVQVPLFTNNGLWAQPSGTIEVWEGSEDLFAHARQLRAVQPDAPGVTVVRVDAGAEPEETVRRMAQVLAAGSQCVLAGPGADEVLQRGPAAQAVRTLATFASAFGSALAACHPSQQGFAVDPALAPPAAPAAPAVVPLAGSAGTVVWVFAPRSAGKAPVVPLVTPDGRALHVHLGEQPVAWVPFNLDLHGAGRLEWCNLSPLAMVGKRMLVVHGTAGTAGALSTDGAALEFTVPARGARPLVLQHQKLVVVVLNEQHAAAAIVHGTALVVGAAAVLDDGTAVAAPGFKRALRIAATGALHEVDAAKRTAPAGRRAGSAGTMGSAGSAGSASSAKASAPAVEPALCDGTHTRYALLRQPQTLAACGAPGGAGWYRVTFEQKRAGKRLWLWPRAGGRVQWWLDGKALKPQHPHVLALQLSAGQHRLVARVEHVPAAVPGTLLVPAGLASGPVECVPAARIKGVRGGPGQVDPFTLRRHLRGVVRGGLALVPAAQWAVPTAKGSPMLVLDLTAATVRGVVSVGDTAVALVDAAEPASMLVVLDPASFKVPKSGQVPAVRFTPFEADAPAAVQRALGEAAWYALAPEQPKDLAWAFASAAAATPRLDARGS